MPAEPADHALVTRAQAGDRAAFNELLRRYHRPVYGFVFRLTQSPEEAADLAQEVFVRAWRYLGKFDAARPLRPWLFQIAANRAASCHGRSGGRETIPLEELPGEPSVPDDTSAEPERQELAAAVRRAILELSPQQRQAVVLVELEGMDAAEAAVIMTCSPTTVRQHVFRAKRRLRGLLAGYVEGTES
ncbi:MAG: RNA polymerase sigma factor [Armatimonadetes bacterium]|nr:RNA polymerase sigma factor [Armatimonadota bacterium]